VPANAPEGHGTIYLTSLYVWAGFVLVAFVCYLYVDRVQLDISAKYKMVMEELQFLPVTIDGW